MDLIDGGIVRVETPVLYRANPEIIWSPLGRVIEVTSGLLKNVPFSSVNPDPDKLTEPTQLFEEDVVELSTLTYPPPEQL
jgi:hypothetical protein